MIEREFIAQKTKEYYLKKYIKNSLRNVGISKIKLKKIPMGEKIVIYTSRPSLVVGSKGSNIKDLTRTLKKEFHLENPQIEIAEVKDVFLEPHLVAEKIKSSLEKFGAARFKSIGHKIMENVMNSGALGVELIISGKIPSARAKSWRFYQGYLKKCGDVSVHGVRSAQAAALLKSGIIGIKVAIMPPDIDLPDRIEILDEPLHEMKEVPPSEDKKSTKKRPAARKRSPAKKKTKDVEGLPAKESEEVVSKNEAEKVSSEKDEKERVQESKENQDSQDNPTKEEPVEASS